MTSPRVLIAKPGLDGHDRAAHLISRVLRDAGMEVVYSGLRQTPAAIARAAIDEDVRIVGLSILTGGHLGLTKKTLQALREAGASDIELVVGGVIPDEDVQALLDMGAVAVFPSSTPLETVVERMQSLVSSHA